MFKIQTLRVFVNQRLTAAAEEIFDLFERTIEEYAEELCHKQKLLDAAVKPQVCLQRTDAQQPLVSKGEQQECSPSLDYMDLLKQPLLKEEQEELCTTQEEEQRQGSEEAGIIKFTFTPVRVKNDEGNQEKPQCLQLYQNDGDKRGGPESNWNLNKVTDDEMSHDPEPETSYASEPKTDDICDWEGYGGLQSALHSLRSNKGSECKTPKTPVVSSDGATAIGHKRHLQEHSGSQTGVKPFCCLVCGKAYHWRKTLKAHMKLHSGQNCFSCSVCNKYIPMSGDVARHMRTHTGEKPFSCAICGRKFGRKEHLKSHTRIHTGEKPFRCPECDKAFVDSRRLKQHLSVHSGKCISCPVCGKELGDNGTLTRHMRSHTGEKPFGCSLCDKRFTRGIHLKNHKCAAPFRCLSSAPYL